MARVSRTKFAAVSGYDFKKLERRAEQQIERIEVERIRAAQQAFAGTVS